MIESLLASWQQMPLLGAFAIAVLLQLAIYLGWGAAVTASYWILRDRLQAGKVLDERAFFPSQLKSELLRGIASCAIVAVITVTCLKLAARVVPASVASLALEMLALVIFYEAVFYLLHRLLHTEPFLRIHGVHHKSIRTTPWSGLSVHPLEALVIETPILLFALLMPVSVATLVLFQVLLHYVSAVGHGNYDPFGRLAGWGWLKSYMRMHQLHHARGTVNYSTFSPLMDRLFGTHQA